VKRLKHKRKREVLSENEEVTEERNARTIFVGNVPHDVNAKKLKKLFEKYGKVESVRLRCPPLADPRVPKKVAVIKRDFHPGRNSMHAFVRFADVESARNALVFNGTVFQDHHIRVDMASGKADHDQKKAVFLGNVPFGKYVFLPECTVRSESHRALIKCVGSDVRGFIFRDPLVSILAPLLLCVGRGPVFLRLLYALLQAKYLFLLHLLAE
jgi:RNA recognition motif-containing protein